MAKVVPLPGSSGASAEDPTGDVGRDAPAVDPFMPAAPRTRPADLLPLGLLLLFLLTSLIVYRERADHLLGVRSDSWTEANIYVSARNGARNGWAKYRGAAQHQVDRPPFVEDPFFRYAQYPLGTYYINWILYDLGVQTLAGWRWLPMLLSLLSLLLWYLLLCRFVSRWVALLAALLLGTSYGFVDFADHVHQAYSNALVVGMMLCFIAGAASHGCRRLALMAASWGVLFINGFVSWEWYLWSQVFYWGYALLIGVPFRKRWLLIFALAPVLSYGIQAHQRTLALGVEPGASVIDDLLRRTIRLDEGLDTPGDVTLANYPLHVAKRFKAYYGIGIAEIGALTLAWGLLFGGLWGRRRTLHPVFGLALVLLASSVSWWCIMLQHTAVHAHVMRHAQLFYSLILALSIAAAVRYIIGAGSAVWMRAGGIVLVGLLLWAHGARAYWNFKLHSDPDFANMNDWDIGWAEGRRLADVASHLPRDAIILTNGNLVPLLRVWADSPVYVASFLRYPYNRTKPVPGARTYIEMVVHHLRDLYGSHMPRLVYLYFFGGSPRASYSSRPLLWQFVDGTWSGPPDAAHVANFGDIMRGRGSSKYPVVAHGSTWIAFDAAQLFDNLPNEFRSLPPPTRAAFGPPR